MKKFFFTTLVCAALIPGIGHADPSAPATVKSVGSSPVASQPAHVVSANDGKPMDQKQDEQDDRASGNTADPAHNPKRFDSTDDGKQIERKRTDEKNDDRRESNKKGPGDQTGVEKEKNQPALNGKEAPVPGNRNLNTPENANNLRQPANASGLAGGGPLKTAGNRPLSARSTGVVPPGGSSFGNPHNHGSAPAVIGGPASTKYSMAGTINGTAMFHKP
jgi:hypothetical protein